MTFGFRKSTRDKLLLAQSPVVTGSRAFRIEPSNPAAAGSQPARFSTDQTSGNAMYTGFYRSGQHIQGCEGYTRYFIREDFIYGPKGNTHYYVSNDCIFGPKGYTHYFFSNEHLCGPSKNLPWISRLPNGRADSRAR
jgi:hypothetical protein